MAMKLDARAERLAVTALDLAERAAASRPPTPADFPWLVASTDDEGDLLPLPPKTEPTE